MHINVIVTNKRCIHAQSNYTNTKQKACFRCLLHHPARKRSGPILHPVHAQTHTGACVNWLGGVAVRMLYLQGSQQEVVKFQEKVFSKFQDNCSTF